FDSNTLVYIERATEVMAKASEQATAWNKAIELGLFGVELKLKDFDCPKGGSWAVIQQCSKPLGISCTIFFFNKVGIESYIGFSDPYRALEYVVEQGYTVVQKGILKDLPAVAMCIEFS